MNATPPKYCTYARTREYTDAIPMPERVGELPPNKLWRGIPTNLLIDIGAYLVDRHAPALSVLNPHALYIPSWEFSRLSGGVYAATKVKHAPLSDDGKPVKTQMVPSSSIILFLYDYVLGKFGADTPLVVVEGTRDALHLIANGVPAVALQGTGPAWDAENCQARRGRGRRLQAVVERLNKHKIVLCLDGDKAGIHGMKKLRQALVVKKRGTTLESSEVCAPIFNLAGEDSPYMQLGLDALNADHPRYKRLKSECWDPASMPAHKLKELKALLRKL